MALPRQIFIEKLHHTEILVDRLEAILYPIVGIRVVILG